jgi:hypothetical protein
MIIPITGASTTAGSIPIAAVNAMVSSVAFNDTSIENMAT